MNESNKILIVGLGNPGKQYKSSPHNAGFQVIDELLERITGDELPVTRDEKSYAAISKTKLNEYEVFLIKPMLFMNRSGVALQKFLTTYNLEPSTYNLITVHDDVDLPLGLIRRSYGSSSGGHKGVQDIIERTGTKDFYRFRIGIRTEELPSSGRRDVMKKFVTKKMGRKHKEKMKEVIRTCAGIIYEEINTPQLDKSTKNYEV